MQRPQGCLQPILISGFESNTNNTDTSGEYTVDTKNSFDRKRMTSITTTDPTETTGADQNESQFVCSILGGKKPTLRFRTGDFVNTHHIKLYGVFPLYFPFGLGGPDEKRMTRISEFIATLFYLKCKSHIFISDL